jgi:sec-independent protein translocase protein TatC
MCAMALPMVVLFEGSVLFAIVHDRRKARRVAAEANVVQLDDSVPSRVDAVPGGIGSDGGWGDTT